MLGNHVILRPLHFNIYFYLYRENVYIEAYIEGMRSVRPVVKSLEFLEQSNMTHVSLPEFYADFKNRCFQIWN